MTVYFRRHSTYFATWCIWNSNVIKTLPFIANFRYTQFKLETKESCNHTHKKKRNKTESAHVQQLDDHLNANETSVSSSFEQFQFTKRINFIPNWLLERQFMNINTFASQFLYKLLVLSLYLPLRLYLAILFDVILFEFNWNAAKLQNKESECDWDECKRLMQYRS